MNIILLSGGSGKRLWPLSNEVRSKQFLKLLSHVDNRRESMVQRVYRQITEVLGETKIVVATSASQKASIRAQLGNKVDVVVEPERRNTFPAIVLAASYLASAKRVNLDETVIVLPVDPYVDGTYFECFRRMDEVVQSGVADMVLMGIEPSYPSAKYGYILCDTVDGTRKVTGFKEKPDEQTAQQLIDEGALWNGGVFAFKLGYLKQMIRKYLKKDDFATVLSNYRELKKDSFDYEVVEKTSSLAVVTYDGQWKDIGTWNTLTEVMDEQTIGDVVTGENCENTHVINELSIPVVAVGTKNLVIAAGPDGILVSDKQKSSYLKSYVENLDNRPRYEENIWGDYKVLDYMQYEDEQKSLTKQVHIAAGRYLDYCCHHHRDEVWTVANGEGFLIQEGMVKVTKVGDTFRFCAGEKHGLRAITDMYIVVVQIGTELSEEDVEKFDFPK